MMVFIVIVGVVACVVFGIGVIPSVGVGVLVVIVFAVAIVCDSETHVIDIIVVIKMPTFMFIFLSFRIIFRHQPAMKILNVYFKFAYVHVPICMRGNEKTCEQHQTAADEWLDKINQTKSLIVHNCGKFE